MKALKVTQFGKQNQKFIVKNPKKFEFWERMDNLDGSMFIQTRVKKIKIPDKQKGGKKH